MKKIILILFSTVILITGCARKTQLKSISDYSNIKVAILLPLHGRFAPEGNAILNGILASYYNYLQRNPLNISIKVFDSGDNIKDAYRNALESGAMFIIGPLTKENILSIAHTGIKVPTLSLNSVPNLKETDLFQFSLSRKYEISQMVNRAWDKHPKRALIIFPRLEWGFNIEKEIKYLWEENGGVIVGSIGYSSSKNASYQIKHFFNIDQNQKNVENLSNLLKEKLKFNFRRRKDINVIFLIATPDMGRQIRPLLNFYFAGNIPTYSLSLIYSGTYKPSLDRDLDGVIFCGMPWILLSNSKLPINLSELRSKIIQYWSLSYLHYNRFYAIGIDAFYLMLKLGNLKGELSSGISGASGTLFLGKNNHIYRKLTWVKIRNGVLHLLN